MGEQGRQPPFAPEKEAITAVLFCDRLYHGQFEETMTPAAYTDFQTFLATLGSERGTGGVAEMAIQFFVSETPEEFAAAEDIHWVAVIFDAVFQEEGTALECKGVIVPKDSRDLSECDGMAEVACHSLSWSDVAWTRFDWSTDAHGQTPNAE